MPPDEHSAERRAFDRARTLTVSGVREEALHRAWCAAYGAPIPREPAAANQMIERLHASGRTPDFRAADAELVRGGRGLYPRAWMVDWFNLAGVSLTPADLTEDHAIALGDAAESYLRARESEGLMRFEAAARSTLRREPGTPIGDPPPKLDNGEVRELLKEIAEALIRAADGLARLNGQVPLNINRELDRAVLLYSLYRNLTEGIVADVVRAAGWPAWVPLSLRAEFYQRVVSHRLDPVLEGALRKHALKLLRRATDPHLWDHTPRRKRARDPKLTAFVVRVARIWTEVTGRPAVASKKEEGGYRSPFTRFYASVVGHILGLNSPRVASARSPVGPDGGSEPWPTGAAALGLWPISPQVLASILKKGGDEGSEIR